MCFLSCTCIIIFFCVLHLKGMVDQFSKENSGLKAIGAMMSGGEFIGSFLFIMFALSFSHFDKKPTARHLFW